MIFTPKLIGIVAVGSLVLAAASWLHGYRAGGRSVEAEYDALRQAQRMAAYSASEAYQAYKKRSNMDDIRKKVSDEIKANPTACPVIDGKLLQLYNSAGVRNTAP